MRVKTIAIAVAAILSGSSALVIAETPAKDGMRSGSHAAASNGGMADGLP